MAENSTGDLCKSGLELESFLEVGESPDTRCLHFATPTVAAAPPLLFRVEVLGASGQEKATDPAASDEEEASGHDHGRHAHYVDLARHPPHERPKPLDLMHPHATHSHPAVISVQQQLEIH